MTEELKKALEAAKTEEEKKEVAEKFKDEVKQLSDEELDNIAGGLWRGTRTEGMPADNDGVPQSGNLFKKNVL